MTTKAEEIKKELEATLAVLDQRIADAVDPAPLQAERAWLIAYYETLMRPAADTKAGK